MCGYVNHFGVHNPHEDCVLCCSLVKNGCGSEDVCYPPGFLGGIWELTEIPRFTIVSEGWDSRISHYTHVLASNSQDESVDANRRIT